MAFANTTASSPAPVPPRAQEVLGLLRANHNVLISGPPGTGKSRLLAEVARGFRHQTGGPAYVHTARVAIPAVSGGPPPPWLPSPHRTEREVFPTALHSGAKPRDFLRGIVPAIALGDDTDGAGKGLRFEVTKGTLYRASEYALTDDGAALLIIDELNRGPAVAIFGPAIVGLESDKRLNDDGKPTYTTQHFEVLDDHGRNAPYALPRHLYVLAAMNQADTSVEAIDVAFLRRFTPYLLHPSEQVLLDYFGLASADLPTGQPASDAGVYALLVSAWRRVNERLSLGRGPEYQIGHGVLMLDERRPTGLPEASAFAARGWVKVRQHIDEVFFGDTRGVGDVLAAGRNNSPYAVVNTTFADQPVVSLTGPTHPTGDVLHTVLRAVATP
jgi:5-methylcytosine-specific restriction enzyme B